MAGISSQLKDILEGISPNQPWAKGVTFGVKILLFAVAVLAALANFFGPQDIYWEDCFSYDVGYRTIAADGYRIVNNSWGKTKKIEFTFNVNTPSEKILLRYYGMTDNEKAKLADSTASYALLIDAYREGNKLETVNLGVNASKVSIVRGDGLERNDTIFIGLLWLNQENQQHYAAKLIVGGKEYPHVKNRHWWAKSIVLLTIALAILLALFIWLFIDNRKKQRKCLQLEKGVKELQKQVQTLAGKLESQKIITEIEESEDPEAKHLFEINLNTSEALEEILPLSTEEHPESPSEQTGMEEMKSEIANIYAEMEEIKKQSKIDPGATRIIQADIETLKRLRKIITPPQPTKKRFKVALTFPGERRSYVEEIANLLVEKFGKESVFYDKNFEAELARPDLDIYLQNIYHDNSELLVVFLCAEYGKKEWCGIEWRAVRDLIKSRRTPAIMPIRFDDTHIPGLFSIDGYVNTQDHTPEEVAKLIIERYQINQSPPQ